MAKKETTEAKKNLKKEESKTQEVGTPKTQEKTQENESDKSDEEQAAPQVKKETKEKDAAPSEKEDEPTEVDEFLKDKEEVLSLLDKTAKKVVEWDEKDPRHFSRHALALLENVKEYLESV